MTTAKEVHHSKKMTLNQVITFSFSNIFKQAGAYGQWLLLSFIVVLIHVIPVILIFLDFNSSTNIPYVVALIIVVIIDIFFVFYTFSWFLRVGLDVYEGIKRSFGERFKLGFKESRPIAVVTLLILIINSVFYLPWLVLGYLSTIGESPELDVLIALSFYFIFLPFSYFIYIKFICAYGLILEEQKGIVESIKLSWQMTKGRVWRIFGYILLINLLINLFILFYVISIVIVFGFTNIVDFTMKTFLSSSLLALFSFIVLFFVSYIIPTNMIVGIYKRLCIEHTPELTESPQECTESVSEDDIHFEA